MYNVILLYIRCSKRMNNMSYLPGHRYRYFHSNMVCHICVYHKSHLSNPVHIDTRKNPVHQYSSHVHMDLTNTHLYRHRN